MSDDDEYSDDSGSSEGRVPFSAAGEEDETGDTFRNRYKGARMTRQQRRDDQIYGVLGESSDDDERPRKGGAMNRKRNAGGASRSGKPVHFVSSSSAAGAEGQEETRGAGSAEPVRDETVEAVLNIIKEVAEPTPVGITNSAFRDLLRASEEEEKTKKTSLEKKALPAVPLKDLGKWEKHTKGVGRKLLDKFGFKGRLGAREDGISKAIEVTIRPDGMGLGFGNFKEATKLEVK
jgi:hypothetical protein